MLRKLIFVFTLALFIFVAPISAQTPPIAYLYDGITSRLLPISVSGAGEPLALPLPENSYASAFDMSFTGNGSRVAYCPINYGIANPDGSSASPPNARLLVRDLATSTTTLDLDLGAAIGCRPFWRDDGAFVAVGIVRALPGDILAAQIPSSWELMIIEPASGGTLAALNAATGSGIPMPPGNTFMPLIRRFTGTQVTFGVLPYAVGGIASVPAYMWTIDSGALTPDDPWGQPVLDSLSAAGEVAWLAEDAGRPSGEPSGPVPRYNVLRLRDAGGERVVFTEPAWTLIDARYIDDGARIAIQLMAPYDPERALESAIPARWVALDRAGMVSELQSITGYTQLRGAPGGYLLLQNSADSSGTPITTLDYVSAADGSISTLWSQIGDLNMPTAWEFAWTTPSAPTTPLNPFAGV